MALGKGVDEALKSIILYGVNNNESKMLEIYDNLYETGRYKSDVFE